MSETKHVNTDPSALGALAAAINKGDSPVLGTFYSGKTISKTR